MSGGRIIAAVLAFAVLPILYILMLPSLVFGGMAGSGSTSSEHPILNDNEAVVENINEIAFTINQ